RDREAAAFAQVHAGTSDETTGLPTRAEFRSRLASAIAAPDIRGVIAVLVCDVDRFKVVNDAIGHEGGDLFLRAVADRIRAAAADAFVARSSGDEFTIILSGAHDRDDVATFARRVLKAAALPVIVGGREFALSVSIGVALFPGDAETAPELIRSADIAMYEAKTAGRGSVRFFSQAMRENQIERGLIETDLRAALRSDAFRLDFQPIIDLRTGRVQSAEALLRWTHPSRGPVSPALFIGIAEGAGLMTNLGSWVLREGIRQRASWRSYDRTFRLALNVSAGQLADPDFALLLSRVLRTEGVEPGAIELEITESVAMEGATVDEQMRRCMGMGVRFSLDDFGTHYSSLSYLQRLSVERVKIDRSFIAGLPNDVKDAAIAKAVIELAHSLGRSVVAEGVENARQLAWLQRAGCDFAQGYFLGRPMGADQFDSWIGQRARENASRQTVAG
ncbi:MAG TPA: bifunctional diguanylate cyclase/phosphodiesterase, partial [Candidatus Acidoferrales bacterium]|nr:bifunctional diguanylate cyclase/phosphodiesterase [Candidatus Acidoferrales bacterium]